MVNNNYRSDLKKLDAVPDFSNAMTREVIAKFSNYTYNEQAEAPELKELPYYGPVEIEPNVYYYGQWKNGLRYGRGK